MKAPVPLRHARCIPPPELALEGGNPDSIDSRGAFHRVKCPEGEFERNGPQHREFEVSWCPLPLP